MIIRQVVLQTAGAVRAIAFAACMVTLILEPRLMHAQTCELYPIALSAQALSNAQPGAVLDILNGTRPGNFGWLSWGGSPSEPALVASLTPPGNSITYVNPDDPTDHQLSIGDWVRGKPGVSNSKNVRDALDMLKTLDITVPVWSETRGQGDKAAYRICGFARVRLLSYHLPGQNRITARFLGYVTCDQQNRPPTVNAGPDQTITLPALAVLNGTVSDDGLPPGSTVTVFWSTVSGPGAVTFADPTAPATTAEFGAPGVYVLRLTASDSELTASDEVLVTVNRANRPPAADAQSVSTDEDVPVTVTLTGSDPDGDALTFVIVDVPAYGALSGAPPHLTYTPKPDYHGPDQFSFKVSDGELDSGVATVTITVRPVNDAPVADALSLRTPEDTPLEITLSGSDIEGSPLQFSLLSNPAHGTLIGTPPHLVYQPTTNYHGTDSFLFRVNDGELDSAPAVVSILVESVNDAPVVDAGPDQIISLPTNTVSLCGVVDDDAFFETNSLQTTWSVVSGPGTVTFADAHALETTATFGAPGIYILRLSAWDWLLDAADELVVVVNGRPSVSAGPDLLVTYPESATLNGYATDDGLPTNATLTVSWSKVSGPGTVHFSAPDSTNTTATFSESGVYVLRLTASDSLAEETDEVRVTVNRAPIVDAGPDQTNNVFEATLLGTVTDDGLPEGTPLTVLWSKVSGPGEVVFAEPTNAATTVTFSHSGIYILRLTASDSVATNSAEVCILVNQPPFVDAGPEQIANFGTELTLYGTVTDDGLPAGIAIRTVWSKVSGPGVIWFADANSSVTTATASQAGVYVLRLTADDTLATNSADVTIRFNLPPVAQSQSISGHEGQPSGITLSGSDPDGDPIAYIVVAGPTSGTLTGTAPYLVYTPESGFFGEDGFSFVVTDGMATSAVAQVSIRVAPKPRSRTYTLDADFLEGQMSQLQATNNELILSSKIEAFNNLWVAVSSKGTIVRIDTETGEIKGEYKSAPDGEPTNPSRTTVDLNGSVWAANRNGNSVVHICVPESGLWQDRNGNGVLDTSTGLGDVRPWPNPGGVDSNGGVSSAQDELIIHYVKVRSSGTRHVSVTSDNNVWVSGTGGRYWDLIDGRTGQIIRQEPSVGYGGYGGLIDPNGVIWSARPLLRWDTSKPLTGPNGINWRGYSEDSYGIGIDSKGNIWVSQIGSGTILKIAPDGTIIGRYYQGNPNGQGVAVDLNDDVWVAHSLLGGTTVGHLKNDGTFVGNVNVGNGPTGVAVDAKGKIWVVNYYSGNVMRIDPNLGPIGADGKTPVGQVDYVSPYLGGNLYNYSDMTGRTLTGVPGRGNWSVVYDSTIPQAQWGPVAWNSKIYDDGQLQVAFSTSEDGVNFGPEEILAQPNAVPQSVGRYARLRLTFVRASNGKGPILQDITLGTIGYDAPIVQPMVGVDVGPDHSLQLPLADVLQASVVHNGFLKYNTNQTFIWSKVSGPGTVTFANPYAATTTARFSDPGVYIVRAQTTLLGTPCSDDVQITAFPVNRPPWVDLGPNRALRSTNDVLHIEAITTDDGLPEGSVLALQWSKVIGPGTVTFSAPNSATNNITFSAPGIYILQLSASDGQLSYAARLEVRVQAVCSVEAPPGIAQWWTGNAETRECVRGNDIYLMAGASYAPAQISYGFLFNGTTNYAKAYEHPALDIGAGGAFTIEFWVKPSSSGRLFSWYRGGIQGVYADYSTSGNALTFHLIDTNGLDHPFSVYYALNPSQFQHVALTYDQCVGVANVFINGMIVASHYVGAFTPRTTGDFYLAGGPQDNSRFGGIIDELSLYNRALNGDEIYQICSANFIGKCPIDNNLPPIVNAGPDLTLAPNAITGTLNGSVSDDGKPEGIPLYSEWRMLSGPGVVAFAEPNNPLTTATFTTPGIYVLELYADDAVKSARDLVEVRVDAPCTVKNPAGLAAWWPGNNSTADVMGGNPVTRINGATFTNGLVSAAFHLDGVNDFCKVQASPQYDVGSSPAGFTVEFWMRPSAWQDSGVLGWANGVRLERFAYGNYGNSLRCYLTGSGTTAVHAYGVLNPGAWAHVAVSYDRASGLAKLYVNGVLSGTATVGTNLLSTAGDFYLGQVPGLPGYYGGQLDEISLYTRPLAQAEIQAIYNAGSAGKCVSPKNQPPTVSAGPDKTICFPTNSVTLHGVVIDDGLPAGNELSIVWTYLEGNSTVFFSSTNTPVTTVTFTNTGVYIFELTASDGEFTAADTVTVTVLPDPRIPPVISITNPANGALFEVRPGGTTNINVAASVSDADGIVTNVVFMLNGVPVGTRTAVPWTLTISNLQPATYTITAVAHDNSGLSATSAPVTVTVFVDQGPPLVEICLPEDGAAVTAPTQIIGTVTSPILQSYTVRYRLKKAENLTPFPWTTLATGNTSVVSNTLAVFDPTMLLNGIYELQLTATDNKGRTALSEIQTLIVDRNLKIGHFTISFRDLSVPVAGIPIEIIRTYDSRAAAAGIQGDFGIGWSLDIRNVRLQKSRNIGPNWYETVAGGLWYFIDPVNDRLLTVTLADGRVFKFKAKMSPSMQFGVPIYAGTVVYEPTPDTHATLVSLRGDDVLISGAIPGYVDLFDADTGDYYNPTLFKLTTADGEVFIIDEHSGLQRLSDRTGNTLLVGTNGIFWTNTVTGGPAIGITFIRDAQGRITQILDPAGNALRYAYGANGCLAAFTDRETNTTTFAYTNATFPYYLTDITDPRGVKALRTEYDQQGRMIRQIDAAGNAVRFTHDLANRREIITDRLGNTTIHEYDERGNITRTIDPLGNVTLRKYDAFDNEIETVDALGNTNRFTYDAKGNKLTETDPLGNTTRYTYGPYRELTSITNPRGFTSTNRYDAYGNLIEMRDALGNSTRFTYDAKGNLITQTDPLGNVTSNAYNSFGRMTYTAVIDAQRGLLSETWFDYDANGNQISRSVRRTTPHGVETNTTFYIYDKENRLIQTIHPDGSSNTTVYAPGLNKPAIEIDPLGRQTLHFYDERGNLTNTVYPDGTSESWFYDAENRKIAETDRAGRTTFYTNDALGRLTATLYPDGSVTNTFYDAIGRVFATQDERGNVTWYGYDPYCGCSGRQTYVTNALGQVTHRSYDQDGNEVSMTDALGRTYTYVYDALDRRTHVVFPDGSFTVTTYDALGRRIAETDQNTNTTWYAFDALGRLVAVTNALGHVTTYSYDEVGNLISHTDAEGRTTTFEYDSMGRRIKRTLPGGQTETYQYDLAGNLISKTDFNGYTTTYQYDSMNRLVAKIPDPRRAEPPVTYAYNALGLRTNMTDASGSTAYTYDSRNRLVQKIKIWGGAGNLPVQLSNLLNYSYDPNGNLTGIVSSDPNGANVGYEYDVLNRLIAVNDAHLGRTAYNYDGVGNLQSYTYPNGVNSFYQYDSLNRLTNLTSGKLLTPIANYAYTVGPAGNRLTANETVHLLGAPHTIARVYTYDDLYRLVGEDISVAGSSTSSLNYNYDPVGNRLSRQSTLAVLFPQAFSYDANDRLTSDLYDNNGNTLFGSVPGPGAGVGGPPTTLGCAYDFENRLIYATTADGKTIRIWYDGDGNRVKKTVTTPTNSVTTFYVVDEQNPTGYAQVLEEHVSQDSSTPTLQVVYTYGLMLISQDRVVGTPGPEVRWVASFYGHDGHNNVRYLTDLNGIITDTFDYDAFGNLISCTGDTPNNYLYCGEQFDPDLGLYFLRARYLNPDTGRFWTMDSFEGRNSEPFSLHKYLYANADPVNVVDPTGHTAATLAEVPNVARIIGMMARTILPALRPAMIATTAVVVIVTLHYAVTAIELEDLVVWSSNKHTEDVVKGLLDQAAEHAAKLASLGGGDPQDPNNWDRNKWKGEVKAHLERAKRLVEKRLKHSKSKAQEYLQRIQEIADKSGITLD